MNTRIDISTELTLPCQRCNTDTPKIEKFGWKPGMIFDPAWHDWFARLQLAKENRTDRPAPPEADYYMVCPDCNGSGDKQATLEEFVLHHLTPYQMEMFKTKKITFVKDNVGI